MKIMVALEMYRALEKKYSEAVEAVEALMKEPMKSCSFCEREKVCEKNGKHCVPVWKGRRTV